MAAIYIGLPSVFQMVFLRELFLIMRTETVAGYIWDHARIEYRKLLLAIMSQPLHESDTPWYRLPLSVQSALIVEMREHLCQRERTKNDP